MSIKEILRCDFNYVSYTFHFYLKMLAEYMLKKENCGIL